MGGQHNGDNFPPVGYLKQSVAINAHDIQDGNIKILGLQQVLGLFKVRGLDHIARG